MRNLLLLIGLCLSLSACKNRTNHVYIPPPDQELAYNTNLALWQEASAGKAYQFDYRISCYCSYFIQNIRVWIDEQGEVEDIKYFDIDGEETTEFPEGQPSEYYERNIDDLFTEISDQFDNERGTFRVKYNAEYGYPEDISIDALTLAIDDEISFSITELNWL